MSAEWGSEYDPTSGKYFYFNDATGETSWDPPRGWNASVVSAPNAGLSQNEWITELDPDSGKYFYVNLATQETTWEMPPDFENLDDLRENNYANSSTGPRSPLSSKWKKAFAKVRTLVALNRKFAKPSWEKHFDEDSGEYYYHNTITGKSTWIEPKSMHFEPRGPISPKAKQRGDEIWGDESDEKSEPNAKSDASSRSAAYRKRLGKKTKEYNIKPVLEAAMNGSVDAMLEAMEVGVATTATHQGRSLFSGQRDLGLPSETQEERDADSKDKANDASESKDGEQELDENGEPVKTKKMSQKAIDHYRVQNFRRKRFATIINKADSSGVTALHSAAIRGQESIIRKLIELGANLNVRDKALNTPLILATQKGHLRAVYILMRAGADPSLRSKWGQTAYDVARYRGYLRIARLFEEGEKEFDIVEMYVDRKWYQVDVHMVRHGKTHMVPIEDTTFYIKTKYRTKAHTHHIGLH